MCSTWRLRQSTFFNSLNQSHLFLTNYEMNPITSVNSHWLSMHHSITAGQDACLSVNSWSLILDGPLDHVWTRSSTVSGLLDHIWTISLIVSGPLISRLGKAFDCPWPTFITFGQGPWLPVDHLTMFRHGSWLQLDHSITFGQGPWLSMDRPLDHVRARS